MYSKPISWLPTAVPAGATGAALAVSGVQWVWIVLAAFALIAAGSALWRVVPRNGEV